MSDIICYLPRFWDVYSHRPHIEAMSEFSRVLCFQPPVTLASIFVHPAHLKKLFKNKAAFLSNNLILYQLIAFVPYALTYKYKLFEKLNRIAFRLQYRKISEKLNIVDFCLYIFRPEQKFILSMFPKNITCYEVHDEYSLHPAISKKKRMEIQKLERDLLEKIDIVFAFSESIYERKKHLNQNTYFIGNGIIPEDFTKALKDDKPIPSDLRKIKSPIIGFAGRINELMEVELMNWLTDTYPNWSFVMLGEINGSKKFLNSAGFVTLMKKSNLFFLGWKNYSVLPYYYKHFDVCIMPYVTNEYGHAINPQKQYQYSAVGKPVVSTDIRDVKRFDDIINIAGNKEEFGSLIEKSLYDNSAQKIKERILFAEDNSLRKRAKDKLSIIQDYSKIVRRNFCSN